MGDRNLATGLQRADSDFFPDDFHAAHGVKNKKTIREGVGLEAFVGDTMSRRSCQTG